MTETTIVLLHGAATGSSSWNTVAKSLVSSGATVFAPDMLGYVQSPAPTDCYGIAEEVSHLTELLDRSAIGTFHLLAHSLGTLVGLQLRRALNARVTRMPLIEPVVVSVLREAAEG